METPERVAGCSSRCGGLVEVHLATCSPQVLFLKASLSRGLALDSTPRYCMHDPLTGGLHFRFSPLPRGRGSIFVSLRGAIFIFMLDAGLLWGVPAKTRGERVGEDNGVRSSLKSETLRLAHNN